MKLSRIALLALPVAVAGVSVSLAVSADAAVGHQTAARASKPVTAVYGCDNEPSVRPRIFAISCDSSDFLDRLSWTSWTATEAVATGVNWINDCEPSCAAGKFTKENVIVVLWRSEPVARHNGLRAYTEMTLLYPGSGRAWTSAPPGSPLP